MDGLRTLSFSSLMASANILLMESVQVGRKPIASGQGSSQPTPLNIQNWLVRLTKCSGASCRLVGIAISPFSRLIGRGWLAEKPQAKYLTFSRKTYHGSSGALRTSVHRTRPL